MPSNTIKPAGGGSYTTLQTWADGVAGNAGTEDAVCFAGNCGDLLVSLWTNTSSTISVDASARHVGVDNGTTGIAYAGSVSLGQTSICSFTVKQLYITSNLDLGLVDPSPSVLNCVFEQLLVLANSALTPAINIACEVTDNSSRQAIMTVRNNVVIVKSASSGADAIAVQVVASQGTAPGSFLLSGVLANNTVYSEKGTNKGINIDVAAAVGESAVCAMTMQNNAAFGFATCFVRTLEAGGGTETISPTAVGNNAASDATASVFGGSNNLNSQTAASWFTTLPTNMTLKSTSPGKDTGATIASFATDIIGTARPQSSAWDIGAFEVIAAAVATVGGSLFGRLLLRRRRHG